MVHGRKGACTGSLRTVDREFARYKLELWGVQDRWGTTDTVRRAGDFIFFYGKGNQNHQMEKQFFVYHRTVSAVKESSVCYSDRMSYIILRSCCCNIIDLIVHAPSEGRKVIIQTTVILRN